MPSILTILKILFNITHKIIVLSLLVTTSIFAIISFHDEIKNNIAIATNPVLYNGGDIYGISATGNILDIPDDLSYCNGIYSCTSSLCKVSKLEGVLFSSIIPRIIEGQQVICDDTEDEARTRLGEDKDFNKIEKIFRASWITLIPYSLIYLIVVVGILILETKKILKKDSDNDGHHDVQPKYRPSIGAILSIVILVPISLVPKILVQLMWNYYVDYIEQQRKTTGDYPPRFLLDWEREYNRWYHWLYSLENVAAAIELIHLIITLDKLRGRRQKDILPEDSEENRLLINKSDSDVVEPQRKNELSIISTQKKLTQEHPEFYLTR